MIYKSTVAKSPRKTDRGAGTDFNYYQSVTVKHMECGALRWLYKLTEKLFYIYKISG